MIRQRLAHDQEALLVQRYLGIVVLVVEDWATAQNLTRYVTATSLKGEANIDWDDKKAREQFLTQIVAEADRALALARQALTGSAPESADDHRLSEAADLLAAVLRQEVTRTPEGAPITDGVAPDRIVSVHDPEMRHGRKSASKRFAGRKAAIAGDTERGLITAATMLPGKAPDNSPARELVAQSEENAHVEVAETLGDCAYGDGATRQAFADAKRRLIAKVPARRQQEHFPKEDFRIDLTTLPAPARPATKPGRWCAAERAVTGAGRGWAFKPFNSPRRSAALVRCAMPASRPDGAKGAP